MDTRMLRYSKYRQEIDDMKEEDFARYQKAALDPSSIGNWHRANEPEEGSEASPDHDPTPYAKYLRERRKPFWIKLGFFLATAVAFVLVYFLVIARS